jgi:succinoglycan biosynthesis transport protein ExoP
MDQLSTRTLTVARRETDRLSREELTIADVLVVLRRRRNYIAITTAICFLLGVIVCVVMTPRFEGKAILEVQKTNADLLGLESIMAGATGGPSDALNANLDLQTESEILKSDALALKVIKDLHLETTRDFQPKWSPLAWIVQLVPSHNLPDPAGGSLENSPQRRASALMTFAAHLKVEPIAGTRLIEVRYFHSDPSVAPAVVNDLVRALKEYGFETRYAATSESSEWLNAQLADLKKQTQELQAKVVNLQKDTGVYSLGTDSQGRDQVYSSTLDRLQQATTALTTATSNRIIKGAVYQTAKNGDPELISGLAGGSLMGASPGVQSSFTLLQTLRSQQASLQAQLAQDSSKFGTEYPKLADERSSLQSVTKAISEEVDRIGKRAANDYHAAEEAEDRLKTDYIEKKAEAERLNDKTIEYGIAKQEADDSRGLYEDLFKRLKEAGVVERLHSSNISVVQPGVVPAKPARPNVPIYLGVSLLGGLFLGLCGALFTDSVDTNIQSIEEIEQLMGSPLLAVLPKFRMPGRKWFPSKIFPGHSMHVLEAPVSPFAEALRGLRTKLLHSHGTVPYKVILVTSSVPGEGKSTVSANLAALLARSGKRVLLVEADMRNPPSRIKVVNSLAEGESPDKFEVIPPARALRGQTVSQVRGHGSSQAGGSDENGLPGCKKDFSSELSVLLADEECKLQCVPKNSLAGLEVMRSGPTPHFPAELLDSERMRGLLNSWKLEFDYIVLDSPPLLAVTDAVVLSHMADVTLLISRPGFTSRKGLKRALELLELGRETRVGVVLNAVDRRSPSYSDYYGYPSSDSVVQTKERAHV